MKNLIITAIFLSFFSFNFVCANDNLGANTQSPPVAKPDGPPGKESPKGSKTTVFTPKSTKITAICSKNIKIDYSLDAKTTQNIDRVEIWYSRGYTGSWQLFGYDNNCKGPTWFIAPAEGIFNILIVAVDKNGQYSCDVNVDPNTNTVSIAENVKPHQTLFVDYTPPQLFLNTPTLFIDENNSKINGRYVLSWTGFDTYLSHEPLTLYWAKLPDGSSPQTFNKWVKMGKDQLAAGKFCWDMPPDAGTKATIKAVLTDLAGNADVKYITIDTNSLVTNNYAIEPTDKNAKAKTKIITTESIDKAKLQQQALEYYSRALFYSQREDWNTAYHNCQKALQIMPEYSEAQLLIGDALFRLHDAKKADEYYMQVLKGDPNNDLALLGHIQCLNATGQVEQAADLLEQRQRRLGFKLKSKIEKTASEKNIKEN
ncbi:MAG: tetratricopeptide repeat protein [Phycisphaerae bacterium]|nr:tetratricopeptide repeat protein [Phycisphaerae bacterium]